MKVLLKEEDLIEVLYDYRSRIHAATGYTQAQLFFNRSVNHKFKQQQPQQQKSQNHPIMNTFLTRS